MIGKGTDKPLSASRPVAHLFVSKVQSGTTPDDNESMIKHSGVNPRKVIMTLKPVWLSLSFKVAINSVDLDKIFQEDFWQTDMCCQEWVTRLPSVRDTMTDGENPTSEDGNNTDYGSAAE